MAMYSELEIIHKFADSPSNLSVKMSEAIHNPYAYTCLTDHVFHHILLSPEPELEEV